LTTATELSTDIHMARKAPAFLEQALADGPLDANEARRRARKQKQTWRTVELAKTALGIQAQRTGGVGNAGKWQWALPG
jgi:hypothetical protein